MPEQKTPEELEKEKRERLDRLKRERAARLRKEKLERLYKEAKNPVSELPAAERAGLYLAIAEEATKGGNNFCAIREPTLDALIDGYRSEPDRSRRLELRRQLHREFDRLQPFVVLFTSSTCVGMSRRFANVKVHDLGIIYQDFVLRSLWEAHPPADAK